MSICFGIIEKGFGRANKVNQGVCNHHHLGNGGKKKTYDTLKYMVR